MEFIILIILSYLVGSIPFAVVLAKIHGKDLRAIGSGNVGATNLSRALGRKWGYLCFVLDVLKGFIPMLAAKLLIKSLSVSIGPSLLWLWLAVGCAAIVGHIFPVYIKFKGGKRVATSFGVAVGLWPYYTICAVIALGVWLVVVLTSRLISLASIIGALVFPVCFTGSIVLVADWYFSNLWPLLVVSAAIPTMVIARHSSNIKRLLRGTEKKVLGT